MEGHIFWNCRLKLYLQTLVVFIITVASLLSMATVGGTPRLNSSLHSSKISSDTNSLSLMLNNPIGTENLSYLLNVFGQGKKNSFPLAVCSQIIMTI